MPSAKRIALDRRCCSRSPKGSRLPLLVNTFGSVRRMELAFEVGRLEEVADRIKGFLAMESPQGLFDKIKMLPKLAELGSFFPKSVKDGDCKEVIRTGSGRQSSRFSDFEMLAAGRRAIHHLPAGVYAKSGDREAQRGHVSHAGLRRAHHGHALADAKAWRGTFPARARGKSRRTHSRVGGDRRRSADSARGHAADSARTSTK